MLNFGKKSKARKMMFAQKVRFSVDINPHDPIFYAQYLGKAELPFSEGVENINQAVDVLISRGVKLSLENLPRVALTFNPRGIHMIDTSNRKPNHDYEFTYNIREMAYCSANRSMKRVFAWVISDPDKLKKPVVNAVYCGNEEVAKIMALLMIEYFNAAYSSKKFKTNRGYLNDETRRASLDVGSTASTSQQDKRGRPELKKCPSDDVVERRLSKSPHQPRNRRSSAESRLENRSSDYASRAKAYLTETDTQSQWNPDEWGRTPRSLPDHYYKFISKEYDPATSDSKSVKHGSETLKRLKVDLQSLKEEIEIESILDSTLVAEVDNVM